MSAQETVREDARDLPVIAKVDVLVAGGGPAGVGAAIGAAREGAKVLLVEQAGFLGGVATGTEMAQLMVPSDVLEGASKEIWGQLIQEGFATAGNLVAFDTERWKDVALEKVLASGADVLFHAMVAAPVRADSSTSVQTNRPPAARGDGDTIKGIIIESKSGRQAILARTVVDCTGDADIAYQMGAPYQKGRESDNKMRPITVLFRAGGFNFDKIIEFARRNPRNFSPDPNRTNLDPSKGSVRFEGFYQEIEEARKKGEVDENCYYLRIEGINLKRGIAYINSSRVYGVDGTNVFDLTKAEIAARCQNRLLEAFIRKYVPGGEDIFVLHSGTIGVRETRRIRGTYVANEDDWAAGVHFEDSIVQLRKRRIPGVPIHSPDGGEGAPWDTWSRERIAPLYDFEIPYRTLVPLNVQNLLVAGRSISGTQEADSWFRDQHCVMTIGQGAGVAAALASRHGITPRQVNVAELRARIAAQGITTGGIEAAPTPPPAAG